MIYMEGKHLEMVRDILKKYDYTFYAFGSRVKGTHKPLSDLDLAIMDGISLHDKNNIDDDFTESNLPFKVDVVNYQTMCESLKNIIQKDLEIFTISTKHVPNPDVAYPMMGVDNVAYKGITFLKNIISNKEYINIGDYTYYHDFVDVYNFEKNVLYHYSFIGDKLIIGKFCQIAADVKFIMNGAHHAVNGISTYPFKTFSGSSVFQSRECADSLAWDIPFNVKSKGDTVVGNDVWIGYNSTIMPGVQIGDGAIIGTNATVTKNVPPYSVVGGNPARVIKQRFDDVTIAKLLKLKWWEMDIEKINSHIKDIGLDISKASFLIN